MPRKGQYEYGVSYKQLVKEERAYRRKERKKAKALRDAATKQFKKALKALRFR